MREADIGVLNNHYMDNPTFGVFDAEELIHMTSVTEKRERKMHTLRQSTGAVL